MIPETMKAGPELDAAVAVEVMGWTPPRIGTANVPPFPMADMKWDYFNPPPEVEAWRSDYHWRDARGACWREPREFSTHISAAWDVVERMMRVPPTTDEALAMTNTRFMVWWKTHPELCCEDAPGAAASICNAALSIVRAARPTPTPAPGPTDESDGAKERT